MAKAFEVSKETISKTIDNVIETVDGRHARRERSRLAVIDAMLFLVSEGHVPPTVEQVAERADVSTASVFRYFDTLDDLRRATTDVFFERNQHLFEIPEIGEGPLSHRIESFVAASLALFEENEPMARLVRLQANHVSTANELLHRLRATRADQVRHHFDDEFQTMTPATEADIVMVIATLTSFESWDQARHDHQRSRYQVRRAWVATLTKLLAS
jgi:AcrR family transcriptional regulator